MRFEGASQIGEIDFLSMATQDHTVGSMQTYFKESAQYIHRCPFTHCPHHEMLNTHVESEPRGIKVSLDALDISSSYEDNWTAFKRSDNLRQGRYIVRGATNPFITSQYRQRAIIYMLNRMKVTSNSNDKIHSRLLASIVALEKQVFKDSDTKEKYIENLATKLFLIFQELERRRSLSGRTTPLYTDLSLSPSSIKE